VGVAEANAIGEAPVAVTKARVAAKPLGAPFTLWRFYVLVVVTFGLYLLFWSYRIARDAEAVTGEARKAWAYPLSHLFSPWAALLVAVVISDCDEARAVQDPARQRARMGICGWGCLIGFVALGLSGASWVPLGWSIAAIVAGALLTLPAEAAINRARLDLPLERARAIGGFAPWQYLLLGAGAVVWALIAVDWFQSGWQRLAGEPLAAGQAAPVMHDQYTVTPPDAGWTRVDATDAPDAEELLSGPYEQDAVFYLYEDESIESLMQSRRELIAEYETHAPACRELRSFDDARGNVESLLACRSTPSLGSRTLYTIKAIDDGERIAEILVSASVPLKQAEQVAAQDSALAESFRPAR
jgi:hypothetical protein